MPRWLSASIGLHTGKAGGPRSPAKTTNSSFFAKLEIAPDMPSRKPAVSIVLPVRNGEAYLTTAIASIEAQSFPNWELIIVDDGSTDGTAHIVRDWAARDSRIRALKNVGRGLVAALNLGMTECRAPFIARMDADDIARPQRIELQLMIMERRRELVALGGQVQRLYKSGTMSARSSYPLGAAACRQHLAISSPLCHPAVMLRADGMMAVGGYRDAYVHAEDYDLWLRLCEVGEIDNLNDIVLDYRVHGASVTGRHFHEQAVATALARVAAEVRQRGGSDPTPSAGWPVADIVQALAPLNLTEAMRLQATLHYWRAVMLNGGFLDPGILPTFKRILPTLVQWASGPTERKALAFALLRAAEQARRRRELGLALHCAACAAAASPVSTAGESLLRLGRWEWRASEQR